MTITKLESTFAPNLQSVENTAENTMLGMTADSNNAAYGGICVASTHEVRAELQVAVRCGCECVHYRRDH